MFVVCTGGFVWFDKDAFHGFPVVEVTGMRIATDLSLSMNGSTIRVTGNMEVTEIFEGTET